MEVKHNNEIIKAKIDIEDIEKISKCSWWYSSNGYLSADTTNKRYQLHRYIMNVEDRDIIVDHINRDRLDYRKCNLRKIDATGSSINRGLQSNNTSGIIGVSWKKDKNKWEVRLKLYGKKLTIGYSTDLEEATRMRLQAELDIYGEEYAPQRHLFKKYNIHIRNENKYPIKYINKQ